MEQQTGSKDGKRVHQGYILTPCLFNLYAKYIMRNAELDEAQAGIKITRRNINNLRYADDMSLMAESEELKSLLMKVKEESEKEGLKLNIQNIFGSVLMRWMKLEPIIQSEVSQKEKYQYSILTHIYGI